MTFDWSVLLTKGQRLWASSQIVTYSATVLHPSEMAFLENLADKEGFLGGVFHEPLLASPQYILHTDNTSVSSATSSPLSVINTGQFPPFSWGAQQQHSSKPVCQGGKPAAPASPPSLPSTSLPPPPPPPPYSPACPASLLLCLPSGSSCQESAFCSCSKREGEGPAWQPLQIFLPIVAGRRKKLPADFPGYFNSGRHWRRSR